MKRWVFLQASLCAGTTACVAGEWWRSTTDTREQPFSLLRGPSATFFCAAAPTSPHESDEHVSSSHKQEEGEDGPTMPLRLELVQVITRHGLRTPISTIPADKTSVWRCPHEQLSVLTLNTSAASAPQATEGEKKKEEEEQEEPRLELLHNREKNAFLEDVVPLHHLYRRKYEEGRQKLRGNCHMGQLTSEGLLQMKELGEKMRERYVERLRFLSPQLHKKDLYLRSTATNRTFESAQSLLWGLYPPWTRPSGKGGMMTIHMIESRMENMYPRSGCANLTKWIKQTRESKASVQRSVEHVTWKKQLEAALDKTVNSWSALNSTLQSMQAHGHEFPPGLTLEMAQRVREEADWHTLLKFEQERVCRLGIGRFVQDVLHHAQRVVEPETAEEGATERQKKFLLYSGHDNTLSPFLSAFRVFDGRQPPMASAIVIETFVDAKGKYWVRFVYNGKDMLLGGNEPDEYLIDSYHASSSAHQQYGENGKEAKKEEQETEKVEQQEQNAEHKKEEEVETEEQMTKREKKEKKKRKQEAKAHEQQLERETIRKQEKATRIPTRGKYVLAQVIVEQEEKKKQDGNDNDMLTIVTERMVLSPFDEYKARAERMIPSDYDKECEANLD